MIWRLSESLRGLYWRNVEGIFDLGLCLASSSPRVGHDERICHFPSIQRISLMRHHVMVSWSPNPVADEITSLRLKGTQCRRARVQQGGDFCVCTLYIQKYSCYLFLK